MVDEQELHHALLRLRRLLRMRVHLHALGRPASRRPAAASAPSRPARGTCGSWRRSTASCDSRSAARRCRACSRHPSPCCRARTSTALPSISMFSMRTAAYVGNEALLVVDVVLEFVAEVLDEALHRQRRGVAERADRAALRCCRRRNSAGRGPRCGPGRARCGRPCATASRCPRGTACTGRTTPRSRSTTGAAATSPCSASRP